ncbi:MAG: Holliday junction resolvase RecU [Clostridiales bacterium]|nr:Holliday junction resolvase RecU [Clostridiales bacterium]
MATWNSRGLRGSTLEELINRSNEEYREKGLALIQKIPTPITPVKISKESRHITLAYFEQKSTVDYIGAVQGIPVCFDAKECKEDGFPLANVHEHQIRFMKEFERQQGIAFLIIFFSGRNEFYYLPLRDLMKFWERGKNGGKKRFRYEELNPAYVLPRHSGVLVPYLEGIQRDLEERD